MAAPISKKQKPKNRKTKLFLEFDEKARSEYLRGFQKRKNERRKLAQEKNDRKVLDERKALLKQARDEEKRKRYQEFAVIPEIQHLVQPEVYDLPEHTVTIADIGEVDFVGKTGLRLGQNTGEQNDEEDKTNESTTSTALKPIKSKSLRQQLAACSNKLSSQKLKEKKMKKKQMLRQKLQSKKKGKKKRKGKK